MRATTFLIALSSITLTALAQVSLRQTMLRLGALPKGVDAECVGFALRLALSPWFLGGLALYGVSIVLWLVVLSSTPVSAAYPLSSLGFVLTTAVAVLFLGEAVTPLRLLGIALICCGVVVVSRSL